MSNKDIINILKDTAKSTMPKGSVVWLYGSRARGNYTAESDWDILILLDKEKISNQDYDEFAYPITSLGWKLGETITPILYTKNQWQSYSFTPFYKDVEHDKLSIYES